MRWIGALCGFALVACYDARGVAPCVLTCDTATPCPNGLECGSDQFCHGAGTTICTATDAAESDSDAIPPDSSFKIPGDCPAGYNVMISATSSRYRIIANTTGEQNQFWNHDTACAADIPGATHLATLDSFTERDQLALQLASGLYYVGAVQKPTAMFPPLAWIGFDGAQVPGALWAPAEPDDLGGVEADHNEQVAILDSSMGLFDVTGLSLAGAICECDGIPVAATARMYVTDDPNNPN
jgi:hypothetical protein